jgi:hypothetical protein
VAEIDPGPVPDELPDTAAAVEPDDLVVLLPPPALVDNQDDVTWDGEQA